MLIQQWYLKKSMRNLMIRVNSSFIDTLKNNGELQIDNQYETTLAVTPYTNYKINNSDIFKKVALTINYKVEQENKTYQISKLKIREIGE